MAAWSRAKRRVMPKPMPEAPVSPAMIGIVLRIIGITRSLGYQRRGTPERFLVPARLDDVSHDT
jgi:hypothetical protein